MLLFKPFELSRTVSTVFMKKYTRHFAIIFLLLIVIPFSGKTCSMYKLSEDGKTIVGCNEDAWRTTPHIWFEKGKDSKYSCCFTGSRQIGKKRFAAQSGMNEYGLTFSRLVAYHPKKKNESDKRTIENPDLFLMEIMRTCKNINDVYEKFDQYDRTCFIDDVLIYIEPSGNQLIVEPYRLIKGNDPTLVQANFCPSITLDKNRRKQERYRKGKDFLKTGFNTTDSFCRELSSEMHVCRDKIGDGTLLTSIWDTKSLKVTLFFYHDYSEKIVFNLKDEFLKGDHQLEVSSLFTENQEFEQLKSYVTPFNTNWIRILLALTGLLFMFSALYFGVTLFSKKYREGRSFRVILFFVLSICFVYMFVLTTNIEIYYFSSPYNPYGSSLITISYYTPYVILFSLFTIGFLHLRKNYFKSWSGFSKGLLIANSLILASLTLVFFYWGILPS